MAACRECGKAPCYEHERKTFVPHVRAAHRATIDRVEIPPPPRAPSPGNYRRTGALRVRIARFRKEGPGYSY
jgi:hypothetical protein